VIGRIVIAIYLAKSRTRYQHCGREVIIWGRMLKIWLIIILRVLRMIFG